MVVFELSHASVSYGGQAVLTDVSLRIQRGERVALVGKSGAGKTSLLQLFYRQQRTQSALIPQELGLVKNLSVFHNVYMGCLHRHGMFYNLLNLVRPLRREVEAVCYLVRRLELGEDKLFVPTGQLSGGQQQRTAVARAIHQGSPILLGDEPVAAVDGHQSRVVLENLTDTHETVVLALHDVGLALTFTDRVIGLRGGRVILDRPTTGLQPCDFAPLYQN